MANTLDLTTGIVYLKGGSTINLGPLSIATVSGTLTLSGNAGGINLGPAGFIGQLSPQSGYIYFPADGQFRFDNFASSTGFGLDCNVANTMYVKTRTFSAGGTIRASALLLDSTINSYNGISTQGYGVAPIVKVGRATGQTGANANIVQYTVGAADGSFEVSTNILVTATSGTTAFQVNVAYTDEGNTARTIRMNLQPHTAGAFTLSDTVANATGTVPYAGYIQHLRCKAATTITVSTSGTFTTVTYNLEGIIKQTA